jgi:hypothetical protein
MVVVEVEGGELGFNDEIAMSCPALTIDPFLILHLICPLLDALISSCSSSAHPKSNIVNY